MRSNAAKEPHHHAGGSLCLRSAGDPQFRMFPALTCNLCAYSVCLTCYVKYLASQEQPVDSHTLHEGYTAPCHKCIKGVLELEERPVIPWSCGGPTGEEWRPNGPNAMFHQQAIAKYHANRSFRAQREGHRDNIFAEFKQCVFPPPLAAAEGPSFPVPELHYSRGACGVEGGVVRYTVVNNGPKQGCVWCLVSSSKRNEDREYGGPGGRMGTQTIIPVVRWEVPPTLPKMPPDDFELEIPLGLWGFDVGLSDDDSPSLPLRVHQLALYRESELYRVETNVGVTGARIDGGGSVHHVRHVSGEGLLRQQSTHRYSLAPSRVVTIDAHSDLNTDNHAGDDVSRSGGPRAMQGGPLLVLTILHPAPALQAAPRRTAGCKRERPNENPPTDVALAVDHILHGRHVACFGYGSKIDFLRAVSLSSCFASFPVHEVFCFNAPASYNHNQHYLAEVQERHMLLLSSMNKQQHQEGRNRRGGLLNMDRAGSVKITSSHQANMSLVLRAVEDEIRLLSAQHEERAVANGKVWIERGVLFGGHKLPNYPRPSAPHQQSGTSAQPSPHEMDPGRSTPRANGSQRHVADDSPIDPQAAAQSMFFSPAPKIPQSPAPATSTHHLNEPPPSVVRRLDMNLQPAEHIEKEEDDVDGGEHKSNDRDEVSDSHLETSDNSSQRSNTQEPQNGPQEGVESCEESGEDATMSEGVEEDDEASEESGTESEVGRIDNVENSDKTGTNSVGDVKEDDDSSKQSEISDEEDGASPAKSARSLPPPPPQDTDECNTRTNLSGSPSSRRVIQHAAARAPSASLAALTTTTSAKAAKPSSAHANKVGPDEMVDLLAPLEHGGGWATSINFVCVPKLEESGDEGDNDEEELGVDDVAHAPGELEARITCRARHHRVDPLVSATLLLSCFPTAMWSQSRGNHSLLPLPPQVASGRRPFHPPPFRQILVVHSIDSLDAENLQHLQRIIAAFNSAPDCPMRSELLLLCSVDDPNWLAGGSGSVPVGLLGATSQTTGSRVGKASAYNAYYTSGGGGRAQASSVFSNTHTHSVMSAATRVAATSLSATCRFAAVHLRTPSYAFMPFVQEAAHVADVSLIMDASRGSGVVLGGAATSGPSSGIPSGARPGSLAFGGDQESDDEEEMPDSGVQFLPGAVTDDESDTDGGAPPPHHQAAPRPQRRADNASRSNLGMRTTGAATNLFDSGANVTETIERVLVSVPETFRTILRHILLLQEETVAANPVGRKQASSRAEGDGGGTGSAVGRDDANLDVRSTAKAHSIPINSIAAYVERSANNAILLSTARLRSVIMELTSNSLAVYDDSTHSIFIPYHRRVMQILARVERGAGGSASDQH